MKAVLQRVVNASVMVEGDVTGKISKGLLIYLGVESDDGEKDLLYIARKIANMRIFTDDDGKMNKSVKQIEGSILLISQFTLCADTKKGNRPSFNSAMEPKTAERIYLEMQQQLVREYGIPVEMGVFGAHMDVTYTNDGPVTIIIDSP